MTDIQDQDEYIAKLEKMLEQEKLEEDNENIEDLELNSIIQKQNEELQSLEKEIEILKQKNGKNIIIDIFNNNEVNYEIIKKIQEKIINEIISQLNNYLKEYEKKMEEKINQIKNDINNLSKEIIEAQFNKILFVIKENNKK